MTPETKEILAWVFAQNPAALETADEWFARNVAEVGEAIATSRAINKALNWSAAYKARG